MLAGITIFPFSNFNPLSAGTFQLPLVSFVTSTSFGYPFGSVYLTIIFLASVGGVTVISPLFLTLTSGADDFDPVVSFTSSD